MSPVSDPPLLPELPAPAPARPSGPGWRHDTLPRWLHSRWVAAAGTVVATAVLLAALGFLAYQRGELDRAAWRKAELYARVLEEQVNRSFSGADLALDSVGDALAAAEHDETALQAAIQQQSLRGMPFLRSVSVVARSGRIVASTNPDNVGRVIDRGQLRDGDALLGPLRAGRDLAGLADAADAGDARDAGLPARHAGPLLLPLVRPLAPPAGPGAPSSGGVLHGAWLVAALNPGYFANQQQLTVDGSGLHAAMLSYRGELIAASEQLALEPGRVLGGHELFASRLPGEPQGRIDGTGLDGEPALTAFRSARAQPVVVLATVPKASIRAEMARVVQGTLAGTAAVLLLLAALSALAWRSLRSHEAAQHDLDVARDEMATQNAFTDRLFQLSPIPMVVKDDRGRFVRVNRAWSSFTGLAPSQVIGRTLGQLYPAQLAAPHEVQEQMAIACAQPTAYEEQMLDGDGLPRDVMLRVTPYTGSDGQVAGTIGCLMDVSEFREAEARTLDAKAAAERSNAAKTEFLANISHELRTPLQTIIGFSELGSQRCRGDARVQVMFDEIHGAGHRMLSLVNDLLDLSRLDSTVGDIERRAVNLAPALRTVRDELQPLAERRRLVLDLQTPEQPLWARADVFRMQQVLRNVLANAIRFAPEDSTVTIAWGPASAEEHALQVADHGPGIPPDELESIFEAFVQSSRTKSGAGGTGLGLAICRKIMQAHGGSIVAANRAEGGTVFTVRLPSIPAPDGAAAPAPGPEAPGAAPISTA